ncbi:MAG: hypothetical protein JWM98_3127 [Thermoleophilia bacterium]|nr:hypothetical protein [Thermoleophilia bacterium]
MRRRQILRWATVAALVSTSLFATAAAPSIASADVAVSPARVCPAIYPRPASCDYTAPRIPTAHLGYIGWTYLNLNYCAPSLACPAIYQVSTPAWSWNGSTWSQTQLSGGWVYVYPYTGAWRWAWTQSTGWVAVSGGRFEIRSTYAYL